MCGPSWRPAELLIHPLLEMIGVYVSASLILDTSRRTFGGCSHVFVNTLAVVVGVISRRWLSRNQSALEKYFLMSRRRVTLVEWLLGAGFFLIFLGRFVPAMRSAVRSANHQLVTLPIVYYVTAFRFLRIHFILMLLLTDVYIHLKSFDSPWHLETYKHCCKFLDSTNELLNALQDWLLFLSALVLANVGSTVTASKCNALLNVISLGSFVVVPTAVLVFQGERISALMDERRMRLRRMWLKELDVQSEIFTIMRLRNGLGIRWMANSGYMKYSSALSVFANVAAYASLILTTPLLVTGGYRAFHC